MHARKRHKGFLVGRQLFIFKLTIIEIKLDRNSNRSIRLRFLLASHERSYKSHNTYASKHGFIVVKSNHAIVICPRSGRKNTKSQLKAIVSFADGPKTYEEIKP